MPTYTLVLYRADRPTFVPMSTLAGLALTDEQPGVLLQVPEPRAATARAVDAASIPGWLEPRRRSRRSERRGRRGRRDRPRRPGGRERRDPSDASRVTVIRPASRIPRLDVGELWHYRELLWTLVWRDVAVRYKQTFLGVAWAILVPAFTALVYVIVFGKFANFPAGSTPYPSLVVAGVLPMQYFASA